MPLPEVSVLRRQGCEWASLVFGRRFSTALKSRDESERCREVVGELPELQTPLSSLSCSALFSPSTRVETFVPRVFPAPLSASHLLLESAFLGDATTSPTE